MLFQKVEETGQAHSLGVTFRCPKCGAVFSMVTNPGETQLVHALGVKIGGSAEAASAFRLTRETLKTDPKEMREKTPSEKGGGCPFADMLADTPPEASALSAVSWSPAAEARLRNVPEFVRPYARRMIEQMAREQGKSEVDEALMDEAKDRFM